MSMHLSITSLHAIAELEETIKNIEGFPVELMAVHPAKTKSASVSDIKTIVAQLTNTTIEAMESKSRKRETVKARQTAMYFIKEYNSLMALKTIGRQFGSRDHSTVIHALNAVADHMDVEPEYRRLIEEIRQAISGTIKLN